MSLLPTELPASDTDSLAQDVARHSPEFARREAPATFTALAREDFADDVIDPLRLQSESGRLKLVRSSMGATRTKIHGGSRSYLEFQGVETPKFWAFNGQNKTICRVRGVT